MINNRPSYLQTARNRLNSGSASILENVDGRTSLARRYREVVGQLIDDVGCGNPSEAQILLCRRAATIAVWCEKQEAEMAKGTEINIGEFTTAANALRRILADLGLDRKPHVITSAA